MRQSPGTDKIKPVKTEESNSPSSLAWVGAIFAGVISAVVTFFATCFGGLPIVDSWGFDMDSTIKWAVVLVSISAVLAIVAGVLIARLILKTPFRNK